MSEWPYSLMNYLLMGTGTLLGAVGLLGHYAGDSDLRWLALVGPVMAVMGIFYSSEDRYAARKADEALAESGVEKVTESDGAPVPVKPSRRSRPSSLAERLH